MAEEMYRRFLPVALLALVLSAPALGAKPSAASWALPQIKLLTAQGLLGTDPASFRPNDPATRGDVAQLVAGLTGDPAETPSGAARPVTLAGLDARLVSALTLDDAAAGFLATARADGLNPPPRFGAEVVARLLGLRTNHPAKQDDLELLPSDPATRAEAAFSGARILGFRGWEQQGVRDALTTFTPLQLTAWQKRVLSTAFRFIGYPYVWGGTSEHAEAPFGVQARGGFDCSGFVWRVYKLEAYANEGILAATLQGRTTYAMSGEVPKSKRIPLDKLQPADVLFFGDRGPSSKPAQVGHMGLYVGNGWFIHSSEYGVALARLDGWYAREFAWGRRPLAEAGLVSKS